MSTQDDIEDLKPCVPFYGPCTVRDLKPGQTKLWCRCGLSKKQPWCDGSHKGTGFEPLKWTVPEKAQSIYAICNCKYTQDPPYCDATHIHLPLKVVNAQKECRADHASISKLCISCGFRPNQLKGFEDTNTSIP